MSTQHFLILSAVAALAWVTLPAPAQDPLAARDGEITLGPLFHTETYHDIPVLLRGWVFLMVEAQEDNLRIGARIVADLSDLQKRIGKLAKELPLPSGHCTDENAGTLQYQLKTRDENLTSRGGRAHLGFRGGVKACFQPESPVPWISLPKLEVEGSLKAESRFKLAVERQHELSLKPEDPDIELEGPFGELAKGLLAALGVDLKRELQDLLEQMLDPVDLSGFLPEKLLELAPAFTAARFFANTGQLAAEVSMEVVLDGDALRQGEIRPLGGS